MSKLQGTGILPVPWSLDILNGEFRVGRCCFDQAAAVPTMVW